jgi:hypothetical protein
MLTLKSWTKGQGKLPKLINKLSSLSWRLCSEVTSTSTSLRYQVFELLNDRVILANDEIEILYLIATV